MGRCYEFGVSITAGCEHAMVVAPEGGHCGCPTCGATCPGQFKACAQVVAIPGYVPAGAPTGAQVEAHRRDRPALAAAGRTAPPQEPPPPATVPAASPDAIVVGSRDTTMAGDLALLRSMLGSSLERFDRTAKAVEELRAELTSRDTDLIETFERLTDGYQRLTDAIRSEHQARIDLAVKVEALMEQFDVLVSSVPSMTAPSSDEIDRTNLSA